MKKYFQYVIIEKNDKVALFDALGVQITDWFDRIYADSIKNFGSNYFIVEDGGVKAIFDVEGNQISDWFENINPDGLVNGESEYYIVSYYDPDNEVYKQAIFHVSGEKVSDWHKIVYSEGLVKGQTKYYVVKEYDDTYTVYHISGSKILKTKDDNVLNVYKNVISKPEGEKELDILRTNLKIVDSWKKKNNKRITLRK